MRYKPRQLTVSTLAIAERRMPRECHILFGRNHHPFSELPGRRGISSHQQKKTDARLERPLN